MANFEEGYMLRAEEAHNTSSGTSFMKCDENRCDMALIMGTATFFVGWIIGILMNKALDHFMDFKTDEAQERDYRNNWKKSVSIKLLYSAQLVCQ